MIIVLFSPLFCSQLKWWRYLIPSLEKFRYKNTKTTRAVLLLLLLQSSLSYSAFSPLVLLSSRSTMTGTWETWSSTSCRLETWPQGITTATLTLLSRSTSYQGEGELWLSLSLHKCLAFVSLSASVSVLFSLPLFFLNFVLTVLYGTD